MFDGNVIYEMNPVGEINVPQEDKKPNMNDDGKGKISIANGSSGGIRYVECHADTQFQNIQCELSAEQVIALYESGENVVIKLYTGDDTTPTLFHIRSYSDITGLEFTNLMLYPGGLDTMLIMWAQIFFKEDGTILPQKQMCSCTRIIP